jgi:uncharacterized repeat protein (TIGR01451 family)
MANRPWSPNGEWILFDTHVDRPPEERGIHVISPDGSRLRMLSTAPGFPFGWSPDGTRILIRSREGPSSHDDLHVMNADGSGKTRLTADRDLDGEAMWQPRPLVDLSISARGPRRVRVGRAATYRVRVSNQGEDVARNVALTVSLGRKVTLVRFSPRKACRTRGVRSCRLRDVAPRGFVEVAVVVRATRAGRFAATFSASFSGADRAPLDNHLVVRAKALGTRR